MVKADTDLSTALRGDDSFAPSSQGGDIVVLDADAGGDLVLPDGFLVLSAKFVQDGPDLLLQGPNGDTVLIKGYFAQPDHPALTMANGGEISGDLVEHLAHAGTPAQYAQAQTAAGNTAAPIGKVSAVQGTATVFHADGTNEQLAVDTPIYQGDTIETAEGGDVGLVFADNSTFALGPGGRVVINELIYDPDASTGTALMSIVKGVAVLVSGEIAKTDPNAMQVKTPVSTLLVRGTKTGIEVQEGDGETLVILFEEEGASKLGEIVILNDAGSQVLNQLNVAIRVAALNSPPSDPFAFLSDLIQQKFGGVLQFVPDQAALENFETAAGGNTGGDGNIGDLAGGGAGGDTVAGGGGGDTLSGGGGGGGGAGGGGDFVNNSPPPVETVPPPGSDTTPDDPNELLIGTPNPDFLDGAAGNDTIVGLGDNDTLIGGNGADSLLGGNGDDLLNSGSGDDTVFGGDGSDTIVGGSGAGNDYYNGGDGVDTVDYSSTTDGIDVNLSVGYAIGSEIGTDTLEGVENIIGGDGADTIVGNEVANTLMGGNGDDVLAGGDGSDMLIGGGGTDTAVFAGNAADYTVSYGGEGGVFFVTDTVGGGGTDTLAGIEQLVFEGAPLAIDGSNIAPAGLTLDGDSVNENRSGIMIGTLAAFDFNAGDTHTYEVGDARFEIVNGDELWLKEGASLNFEEDSTVAVTVTVTDSGGLSADHTVTVNVNDVNEGPTVDDQTFSVGEHLAAGTVVGIVAASDPDSSDTSFGTLTYGFLPGADNALFSIDSSTGEITTNAEFDYGTAASYTLTVGVVDGGPPIIFDTASVTINVGDTFTGSGEGESLTGTIGADVIDGNGGNDTLVGGDGMDTLIGGSGADQIDGGDGFDLLDYSTDASGGGTGSVSVDLSSNTATDGFLNIDSVTGVEFVRGTSAGDVVIGDDQSNRLEGLGGGDTLTGGAGADTLVGGDGADTLTGGDGSDFFVFNAPADGADIITDFTTGQDVIQVDGAAFGGLGAGTLEAGVNFSVIAGPYDGTDAGANSNFASGDATFVYSQADGVLYFDDNGAAAGYTAIADTGGAPVNAADVHVS